MLFYLKKRPRGEQRGVFFHTFAALFPKGEGMARENMTKIQQLDKYK